MLYKVYEYIYYQIIVLLKKIVIVFLLPNTNLDLHNTLFKGYSELFAYWNNEK